MMFARVKTFPRFTTYLLLLAMWSLTDHTHFVGKCSLVV